MVTLSSSICPEGLSLTLFIFLCSFRYTRLLVSLLAVWLYKPKVPKNSPIYSAKDATVVVPTLDATGVHLEECILSIHETGPFEIIIVTAGENRHGKSNFEILRLKWQGYPTIRIMDCEVMNKRRQLCIALATVTTSITVFCDNHVFWPPNFLPHILAPFADATVGIVGTAKRVCRTIPSFSLSAFCNVLGCLYLEQHNCDIRATTAIDGGAFVISARTAAHRTSIIQTPAFMQEFTNEVTFFGLVGPLNADDDNFITRWMVNYGWKIGWQDTPGVFIETTIGDDEGGSSKFLAQNVRWMRSRWRNNATALFSDRTVWKAQPWCVYAVYLTSFVNFALFYDTSLIYLLWSATNSMPLTPRKIWLSSLIVWIFVSKIVKTAGYWKRNPRDLVYLPGCILFGYFHSLIKLYALFTFWNVEWGSRQLCDEMVSQTPTRTNTTWEDAINTALIEKTDSSAAKVETTITFTDSGYASADDGD